jgi:hypothetical protein
MSVELDGPSGRFHQTEDRPAERGLSAPRLSYEPERLSPVDFEIDPVDRLDVADHPLEEATPDGKVLPDGLDSEQDLV